MQFRIENTSGANVLKIKGAGSRVLSQDEFELEVRAVVKAMQPMRTFYSAQPNAIGQVVSVPAIKAVPATIKVYLKDEGEPEQEIGAKALQDLYGAKIQAQKAARVADKKARDAKRRAR
jgi:hypothetical protein